MGNIQAFLAIIFIAVTLNYFNLGVDNSSAAIAARPIEVASNVVFLPLEKKYDFKVTGPQTAIMTAYPLDIVTRELPKKTKYSRIQLECLARNLYFEARGEGERGLEGVAYVTLNRVYSKQFPSTICGVVYQGNRNKNGVLYRCEFSWACDGTIDKIRNISQWNLAKRVAKEVSEEYDPSLDITKGSLFYHADYISHRKPFKRMKVVKTVQIGQHIFYKRKV